MTETVKPRFKRVLLKLSGEVLAKGITSGILNYDFVREICVNIKRSIDLGVQFGIVVGAGNIWRGRQGTKMDRTHANHRNANGYCTLALQDALSRWNPRDDRHRNEGRRAIYPQQSGSPSQLGRTVIFGCGLGKPILFNRHRGASRCRNQRRYCADGKNIDGVYGRRKTPMP